MTRILRGRSSPEESWGKVAVKTEKREVQGHFEERIGKPLSATRNCNQRKNDPEVWRLHGPENDDAWWPELGNGSSVNHPIYNSRTNYPIRLIIVKSVGTGS